MATGSLLTKQIGELPLWGWGVAVIGGGLLGWYFLKQQQPASTPAITPSPIATGSTAATSGSNGAAPVFCACPVCDYTTGQLVPQPQSPGCLQVACPQVSCSAIGTPGSGTNRPGTVPAGTGLLYSIQASDLQGPITLDNLAHRFGTTVQQLENWNCPLFPDICAGKSLQPGWVLQVG